MFVTDFMNTDAKNLQQIIRFAYVTPYVSIAPVPHGYICLGDPNVSYPCWRMGNPNNSPTISQLFGVPKTNSKMFEKFVLFFQEEQKFQRFSKKLL